jgi:hypothetical protein
LSHEFDSTALTPVKTGVAMQWHDVFAFSRLAAVGVPHGRSDEAEDSVSARRGSIAIDHDTPDIMSIKGLSMAARAHRVHNQAEAEKVIRMLPLKYPDAPPATAKTKMPTPEEVALFRVVPEIVSVLDYTKDFGHTDLVACLGGAA